VKRQHDQDLQDELGEVWLPNALGRKYANASRESIWQYAFPSRAVSVDPRSGKRRRHHMHERTLQAAVRKAVLAAKVPKPPSCHAPRRAFATDLMRRGYDIRSIQKLLGHQHLSTTEKYLFPLDEFRRIREALSAS